MRIHIIGNCQATVLSEILRLRLPSAEILRSPISELSKINASGDVDDWYIIQRSRWFAERRMDDARHAHTISFPRITFTGYHPDAVVAQTAAGQLKGPMGNCHSALALFGWREGLTVIETIKLFRDDVFEKIKYFDRWEESRKDLIHEARATDVPIDSDFDQWAQNGCFMYTFNHPHMRVISGLAGRIIDRMAFPEISDYSEDAISDWLGDMVIFPVYPAIARRLGIVGSYEFVRGGRNRQPFGLDEMVARSHAMYGNFAPDEIRCDRLNSELWLAFATEFRRRSVRVSKPSSEHPYRNLPSEQFWRSAIAEVPVAEVDPVPEAPFKVDRTTKIATAGSCFAQHIARTLSSEGFNHFVVERAPEGMTSTEAHAAQYGMFSARYGNVYTARQLLQLMDRAFGRFEPSERGWLRSDGRIVDPFRPQVEPGGFENEATMLASRSAHLASVRSMFQELEVFVFTLGLTETWRSRSDGAVFPLAPGVAAGVFASAHHEFVNFGVSDVVADLQEFRSRLAEVNPGARMILTVSPVPLAATFEARHVLISTIASKSILRVAADEVTRADGSVWYFPSYEIISAGAARGAYFEPDLRSISPEGVDHVMRLFFRHVTADRLTSGTRPQDEARREAAELFEIVCDEDLLSV